MTCACGAETRRATITFDEDGQVVREYCVVCRPDLYDGPRRDPSDTKLWMGWEYMPNRYRKTEDADGPILMATDELMKDTEDAVCKKSEEALRSQQLEAELAAKKRATRRTKPMDEDELRRALITANQVANAVREAHATIA